jgi:hypothetical protein
VHLRRFIAALDSLRDTILLVRKAAAFIPHFSIVAAMDISEFCRLVGSSQPPTDLIYRFYPYRSEITNFRALKPDFRLSIDYIR